MRNKGLLKRLDSCEYPAEFLAARLLGKKGRLFCDWDSLIDDSDAVEHLHHTVFSPYLQRYGPQGIWRFLQHEHLWVYSRMNDALRKDFETYFVYHEVNTLMACVRYLSGSGQDDRLLLTLHNSLLHDDLQKILTRGLHLGETLQLLESHLCSHSSLFRGLGDQYGKGGLGALEASMRNCFFAYIFSQKAPLLVKTFFQYLVDYHNCIHLAKLLRWRSGMEPEIIPGGTVPPERILKAYCRRDLAPILNFLPRFDGAAAPPDPRRLENVLLCSITARMKKWSFQHTVVADILFYLWEQFRYTRNISMVLSTVRLNDEPVRESIIA